MLLIYNLNYESGILELRKCIFLDFKQLILSILRIIVFNCFEIKIILIKSVILYLTSQG